MPGSGVLISLCLQGRATDVLIRKVEADGMAAIHLKGEGNERDKLVSSRLLEFEPDAQ